MAVPRHQRIDSRFHGKRSAPLHRNADVRAGPIDDVGQLRAHLRGDRVERGVPRAPVAEHRGFGRKRRRQRAGGQQNRVAGMEAHARSLKSEITRRPSCATAASG